MMIDNHNLVLLSLIPDRFNEYTPDGYFYYHNKKITYYQTDSIDRSPVVNIDAMQKFANEGDSIEYIIHDSDSEINRSTIYEISDKGEINQITSESKLFDRNPTGRNVVQNDELNEILNTIIKNRPDVLYGLNFRSANGKVFVEVVHNWTYDREEYDGYFFRDGSLVVLYGAEHATNILDSTWIKKKDSGIPGYRYAKHRSWVFFWPRPYWFSINENGKVEEIEMEDVWDLYK